MNEKIKKNMKENMKSAKSKTTGCIKLAAVALLAVGSLAQAANKLDMKKTIGSLPRKESPSRSPSQSSGNSASVSYNQGSGVDFKKVLKKISIGGKLSTPTAINFQNSRVKQDGIFTDNNWNSGDIGTTSGLAVQVRYSDSISPVPWLGYYGALNIEANREINSFRSSNFGNPPSYQAWIAEGGAIFNINDKFYAPVGLNYTLLNFRKSGQFKDFAMTPDLGYQAGIGFRPTAHFSLELLQKEVRYDNIEVQVEGAKVSTYQNRLAGIEILGKYNF